MAKLAEQEFLLPYKVGLTGWGSAPDMILPTLTAPTHQLAWAASTAVLGQTFMQTLLGDEHPCKEDRSAQTNAWKRRPLLACLHSSCT